MPPQIVDAEALKEPVVAASEDDVHAAQLARKNAAKVESASKLLEKATADPKVIKQLKKPRGKGKAKAKAASAPAPDDTEGQATEGQATEGHPAAAAASNAPEQGQGPQEPKVDVSYESEWKACEIWLHTADSFFSKQHVVKHWPPHLLRGSRDQGCGHCSSR